MECARQARIAAQVRVRLPMCGPCAGHACSAERVRWNGCAYHVPNMFSPSGRIGVGALTVRQC